MALWAANLWASGLWADGLWAEDEAGTAPTITTTTLPDGYQAIPYSQTLAATGDTPITWTVSVGSVPTGLSLSSGGVLSGTPSGTGTSNFTVQATNSAGSDTQALSLTIGATPVSSGNRKRDARRGIIRQWSRG